MKGIKTSILLSVAACLLFIAPAAYTDAPNETQRWNSPQDMQACNNCYNYATNQPNSSIAQPGWASGIMNSSPYTCGGVLAGAEGDGLTFAGHTLDEGRMRCESPCCLVALVNSGGDYHWYREDADRTWSHKPGGFPATNLDASGQIIIDPANANHDYSGPQHNMGFRSPTRNYDMFCGFMCVCQNELMPLQGKKEPKPIPDGWYADCPFPCVDDAPGCLPTGAFSLDPGCCCSCIIRILDVNVGECK